MLASRAGEAWVVARADELRAQQRAIAGAWPGTLTEARARVVVALAGGAAALTSDRLRDLSRTAYRTAQAAWRAIAIPDEEP